ncbi:long-chain-fatty-acid--CoA ligase [Sulfuritalea hydrogenivorans]|uniref:Long-chain-fatty-acid--CoA ligase n=1 Tax=Sulfuritalea hydrogenivorans sk43H TaxID=1223802 RepID=W0SBF2_9PROT|nr:long-chain-fatty-acid--CoA ligase [Sulfuritalea hydrogenivorans]BAO28321.1 long-chain-fatty-acid--coa ligase protein [Sulfuritalea hydrogenivorans sk43H]
MERIWLAQYPDGVPPVIDPNAYRSIPHLMEQSASKFRHREAYRCMGASLSFGDVDDLSRRVAAWLQSKGLAKGARVAVMMPNVLQYPVSIFGVLRAGCIVVNVNPLYTSRELEHQLNDSGAEAIIVLENFAATVQQVIGRTRVRHVVVATMGDLLGPKGLLVNFAVRRLKKLVPPFRLPDATSFKAMVAKSAPDSLAAVDVGPEDIAFLQYTGGTTGVSKGAMLVHRNIIANLEQVSAWLAPLIDERNPHVIVTPLPLYHIYSLTCNCLMMMKEGGCNLLIPNPRDIPGFIKELRRNRFTAITGLNTLYNALIHHPEFASIDFSELRMASAGGMAMQKPVADRWQELTGVPILEGYGLSETAPVVTSNPATATGFSGTIGLPVPSTTVSIRDDEGLPLPPGQAGEICVAGPQVMTGYWQRPDETAQVMAADGAFMTGDIGVMDERGYVKIVDRKKDMILVSGFNVYPSEIEEVVSACPGVGECCAVGVIDAKSGEVPKIFVVRKDPALGEKELIEYCRKNLTAYKQPRHFEFRTELPKSNVGKILRRTLRDEAKQ